MSIAIKTFSINRRGGFAILDGAFNIAAIADLSIKANALLRGVLAAPKWQLLGCVNRYNPQQIAAGSPVTYVDRNDRQLC